MVMIYLQGIFLRKSYIYFFDMFVINIIYIGKDQILLLHFVFIQQTTVPSRVLAKFEKNSIILFNYEKSRS